MAHYICSTHTNPVRYVEYGPSDGGTLSHIVRQFTVSGGHGLCNKHLFTPTGVITKVDRQEDMDWLNALPAFQRDIENGYIRVLKKKEEPETVVKRDMKTRDGSAPRTPKDFVRADGTNRLFTMDGVNASA